MSKSARTRQQNKQSQGQTQSSTQEVESDDPRVPQFLPPLRPSRTRLIIAIALLVVWVGFLLTLFQTTVFPNKEVLKTQHLAEPTSQPGTISR